MSADFVWDELNRVRELLSLERSGVRLVETSPERDPASLGALGGTGFQATDPDIRISIYVFENSEGHYDLAEQMQRELPPDPNRYVLPSTNGPLLFLGHTGLDGPHGSEAEARLDKIASAFAGDEL